MLYWVYDSYSMCWDIVSSANWVIVNVISEKGCVWGNKSTNVCERSQRFNETSRILSAPDGSLPLNLVPSPDLDGLSSGPAFFPQLLCRSNELPSMAQWSVR